MSRTIATARTPISSTRNVASARTVANQFRIPIELLDLGVTHLISWRGGFANTDPTVVMDDISSMPFTYDGLSGVGSIYTTGEYSADFTIINNDTFAGPGAPLPDRTNFSIMGFVRREGASVADALVTQWNAQTSQLAFMMRTTTANEVEVLTNDGTTGTLTTSTSGSFNTIETWEAWGYTKAGTTGTISKNGSRVTTTGTTRNTINAATSRLRIGSFTNSGGALASKMAGKIGLTAFAFSKTWTANEEMEVYNLLRKLGGY